MRTVLLTGACGGIGRAIASKLLGQGYTVYGLDRKGSQPPEGLRFIACDVTVPAGIDAAFQRVQAEAKQLDAIVHTAGVYDLDSLLEMDEVRFTRMFEVNLLGVSVSIIRPGAVKTGLLGDSTRALDRFCENTQLYQCNAQRFKRIVNSVETKNISPNVIAALVCKALKARRPKYVYNVNRNLLLRLLNLLPDRLQVAIIRGILKP